MAYTESVNLQRRRIADMAQALSGSKQRLGERRTATKEAGKQRISDALARFGQHRQEEKTIKSRAEQERQTEGARYAEGSPYTEWEKRVQEKNAELAAQATDPESPYYKQPFGEVEATKYLVEWLANADPKTRETYYEMMRKGTITTEKDSDGLDGPSLIGAMYNDYLQSAAMKGEQHTREGFRAWVETSLQPMPGFTGLTGQQRQSVMTALDGWINILYGEAAAPAVAREPSGGLFGGLPGRQDEVEQDLLRKVMEARTTQMSTAGMGEAAAIEKKWQPIIDEINQPDYLGIRRIGAIQDMIKKILSPEEEEPGISAWEREGIRGPVR